ncbi:hypothetical protein [Synechococcus sp. PCC 7336]|uniref:hypothetical protein n=1 Tax=Synechococcus sp. PCC 7336 TaxID=195250 RepID=UPI0012EA5E92|nr:hypothetical protein [Synechococcus sp. PCC 7336]
MKDKNLKLPEHKGARAHKQLMRAWSENPNRVFRASVEAGVHKEDGTLEELYRTQGD